MRSGDSLEDASGLANELVCIAVAVLSIWDGKAEPLAGLVVDYEQMAADEFRCFSFGEGFFIDYGLLGKMGA